MQSPTTDEATDVLAAMQAYIKTESPGFWNTLLSPAAKDKTAPPAAAEPSDGMSWYLTPVPDERHESAAKRALTSETAKRAAADLTALLTLPDSVVEYDLAQLRPEDLSRLARLLGAALARVGQPLAPAAYPASLLMRLPVVTSTPATTMAMQATPAAAAAPVAPPKPPVALDTKKWGDFPLEKRTEIHHNTLRLRFKLPTTNLGLPVGKHIFLKARIDGKPVMRAYTPVGHGPGYVEFVIKVYFPLPPRFPEGGKLTQHMHAMALGDCLGFKGPLGEIDFDCNFDAPGAPSPRDTPVSFLHDDKHGGSMKHIGFIAGGSGITPCLQVANALLTLERDVSISLLYANQTAEDILCQEELEVILKDPRVRVWYTVDRPTDGWKYSTGFIDEAMCREHLPPPGDDAYIFMCGPPPMLKFACRPNLQDKIGHKEVQVLAF